MIDQTIARRGHETTTRVQRGRDLYREHSGEITFEDGVWLVPSQQAKPATSIYEVVLGRRGESCECHDFEHRQQVCKHIIAATIARAKSRQCAGCGHRFPHREIVEVREGHESLTFFVGDPACASCALGHGVL